MCGKPASLWKTRNDKTPAQRPHLTPLDSATRLSANSRSTEPSSTGKKPQNLFQTSDTPSPLGEGVTLCSMCNGRGHITRHNYAGYCPTCNGDTLGRRRP